MLPSFVEALKQVGIESHIAAYDGDGDVAYRAVARGAVRRNISARLFDAVEDLVTEDTIVHSHGLWSPLNYAASQLSSSHDLPIILSPHGMLLPEARQYRKYRKDLAWWLYQKKLFEDADVIHVTSAREKESVESLGDWQVKELVFGVDEPAVLLGQAQVTPRRMLFMGRIHPIKNLESLVAAWVELQPKGWELVIAGPDEVGSEAKLKEIAGGQRILFPGPVYGDHKWLMIGSAEVIILPSLSENFGAVVAEALTCGRPVITSTGTPWAHLEDLGAGWTAPTEPAGLKKVLNTVTTMSRLELAVRGEKAREYAARHLDWNRCAAGFRDIYDSVKKIGIPPINLSGQVDSDPEADKGGAVQ